MPFFAFEALQALFRIYFWVLSFLIKALSVCKYSFGTWSDFEIRLFQLKLAEKPVAHSFGKAAILWELAKKSSAWSLQDQAVPLELAGIRPAGCLSCKLFELSCLSYRLFKLFENCSFTLEKNF